MRNWFKNVYKKINHIPMMSERGVPLYTYTKHAFDYFQKMIPQLPPVADLTWPTPTIAHRLSFNDILVTLQQPSVQTMTQACAVIRKDESTEPYRKFLQTLLTPLQQYDRAKSTNQIILKILAGVNFKDNVGEAVIKLYQRILPMVIEPLFQRYEPSIQAKLRHNYETLMVEYNQASWTRKYFSRSYATQLNHRQQLKQYYQFFDGDYGQSDRFSYLNKHVFDDDVPISNELVRWVAQQLFKGVFESNVSDYLATQIQLASDPQVMMEWYLMWATLHQYHQAPFTISWNDYLKINLDVDMSQFEHTEAYFDRFAGIGIEQPTYLIQQHLTYKTGNHQYQLRKRQFHSYSTQCVAYQKLAQGLGNAQPFNRVGRLVLDKTFRNVLAQHDNTMLQIDSQTFTTQDLVVNATYDTRSALRKQQQPWQLMWGVRFDQVQYCFLVNRVDNQAHLMPKVMLSDMALGQQIEQLKYICHLDIDDDLAKESPS